MKVVVYLPALNEDHTIGRVLDGIPETIPGVTAVQKIVIDDGSRDGTAAIATRHGATVVRHEENLGTGKTFISGVTAGLNAGADIIVSMDADGQFHGADLPKLIEPVLSGKADVALCTRFGAKQLIGFMPLLKRIGNWLLVRLISLIAGRRFTDVSCGFRAFTRDAALRVAIHSDYEYIHESLLNWSRCSMRIMEVSIPVLAERPLGDSRLMRNVLAYTWRSAPVLIRAIRDYSPMKFFGSLSVVIFLTAFFIGCAVFVHWLRTGETEPYTSFITVSVGGVLLGFLLGILALIADLIARLRLQVDELLYESRKTRARTDAGSDVST
jgi:glycosyltransferase involved in cell wall biosynthesis